MNERSHDVGESLSSRLKRQAPFRKFLQKTSAGENMTRRAVKIARDLRGGPCRPVPVLGFCLDSDFVHGGKTAFGSAEVGAAENKEDKQENQPEHSAKASAGGCGKRKPTRKKFRQTSYVPVCIHKK